MTKLTPTQRKIVRRAQELIATRYATTAVNALNQAWRQDRRTRASERCDMQFREFYAEHGCPFYHSRNTEELRTTRILLLEFFLILDGVIE